jgi:hypothetical protein
MVKTLNDLITNPPLSYKRLHRNANRWSLYPAQPSTGVDFDLASATRGRKTHFENQRQNNRTLGYKRQENF